ncbi:MAG: hypothetical protein M0037_15480 [Betaproteobacteria bacterium]|nr:hypothetical protein [Betaproteobacteria bacterium]
MLFLAAALGASSLPASPTTAAALTRTAWGSAYGLGCAGINAGLLMLRARSGPKGPARDARAHLRFFYRAAIERLVIVAAALAAGMGALGLPALPLVGGFAAGQIALVLSQLMRGIR